MFVVFSSFVMLLLIFVGSAAFTAKDQEPSNVWSPFMTVMRENFPLLYADNHLLFLDTSTVAHGTPLSVFLYTFLTMWIYLVITGLLILLGAVIGKRILTVTAAAALSVTGGAAVRFGGASWLFPMIHTQFGMHYDSLLSTVYFADISPASGSRSCGAVRAFSGQNSHRRSIMINVQELSLTLNKTEILKNITVDLAKGNIHGLIGRNGSGKKSKEDVRKAMERVGLGPELKRRLSQFGS